MAKDLELSVGDYVTLGPDEWGTIDRIYPDGMVTIDLGDGMVKDVKLSAIKGVDNNLKAVREKDLPVTVEVFQIGDQVNTPHGIGTIVDLVDDEVIFTDVKGDEWMVPVGAISKIADKPETPPAPAVRAATVKAETAEPDPAETIRQLTEKISKLEAKNMELADAVKQMSPLREENGRLSLKIETLTRDLEIERGKVTPLNEFGILKKSHAQLLLDLEEARKALRENANGNWRKKFETAEAERLKLAQQVMDLKNQQTANRTADVPVIVMDADPGKIDLEFITINPHKPEEVRHLKDKLNEGGWHIGAEWCPQPDTYTARLVRDIDDDGDQEPGEPIVKKAPTAERDWDAELGQVIGDDEESEVLHVEGIVIGLDDEETSEPETTFEAALAEMRATGNYDAAKLSAIGDAQALARARAAFQQASTEPRPIAQLLNAQLATVTVEE